MLAEIHDGAGSLLYCSDLAPGRAWVHAPITMGYDRAPELLVDEKTLLLQRAHLAGTWLFFVHDPACALARVERDDRGRFRTVDERAFVVGTALGHDLAP
jgi:hypothetical protein